MCPRAYSYVRPTLIKCLVVRSAHGIDCLLVTLGRLAQFSAITRLQTLWCLGKSVSLEGSWEANSLLYLLCRWPERGVLPEAGTAGSLLSRLHGDAISVRRCNQVIATSTAL